MEQLQIEHQVDLAFAFGFIHMQGEKRDGQQVDLWSRTTLCLRQHQGEWKIVHEHNSVPFLMDGSEKAALQLRPET